MQDDHVGLSILGMFLAIILLFMAWFDLWFLLGWISLSENLN